MAKNKRESKEREILELFLDYPTKYWHFHELHERIPLAEDKLSKWLRRFQKEGLITRVKPKGKMPFYISQYNTPLYVTAKKIFALEKFQQAGFLQHLFSLSQAKTVILFGSMIRGDWYKESDIDLFVFGNADALELGAYQLKLGREIQFFACKDEEELKTYSPALLRNIVRGYTVKGNIDFLEVKAHA